MYDNINENSSEYARVNNLVSSNTIIAMSRISQFLFRSKLATIQDCKRLCGRVICLISHYLSEGQYCPNSLLKGYKLIPWAPK